LLHRARGGGSLPSPGNPVKVIRTCPLFSNHPAPGPRERRALRTGGACHAGRPSFPPQWAVAAADALL
jgi:hypothetical protein